MSKQTRALRRSRLRCQLLVLSLALGAIGCGSDEAMMESPSTFAGTGGMTSGVGGASGVGGMMSTAGTGGMMSTAGVGGASAIGGASGAAGMTGGVGGVAGAGAGGSSGMTGGSATGGDGGGGGTPPSGDACTPPPMGAVSDYGARGPFDVMQVAGTGPSGQYTMFRPSTLGEGGFMHPPVSWGNGVGTTPSLYVELLSTVASHGFVVIASDSSTMTAQLVRDGLQWLIEQNDSGDLAGKLAVDCAATIGYSMGGGSAVGAGAHPNVKAVVSLHGLQAAAEEVSGPLLLVTSDNDGFVTKGMFVMPTYTRSANVPTIMATYETGLTPDFNGHLIPLGDAGDERAPMVAWLRYWIYGDQGPKAFFFGADCTLCKSPWMDIQRKNPTWD
jgi:hypothetical protein